MVAALFQERVSLGQCCVSQKRVQAAKSGLKAEPALSNIEQHPLWGWSTSVWRSTAHVSCLLMYPGEVLEFTHSGKMGGVLKYYLSQGHFDCICLRRELLCININWEEEASYSHSFILPKIFIKHLPRAKHCSRHWRPSKTQVDKLPAYPALTFWLGETHDSRYTQRV